MSNFGNTFFYFRKIDEIKIISLLRSSNTDGHACLEKGQFNVEFRRHPLPTFNVHVQLRRSDKGERERGQRGVLGAVGGIADGQSWTSCAKKSDNRRGEVAQSLLLDGRQIFPRLPRNLYRGNHS